MNIAQYVKAESLAEAWELNKKKAAVVLGGGCWLRLSPKRPISAAIDLSGLGMDQLEESGTEFRIGCMVTLRELERSAALAVHTQGAMKEALRHIVGTQFRNMATIGGSLCGRFGFSDVLTLFLVLDAEVELYPSGRMPLADFAKTGAGQEILTHVILPKQSRRTAYASLRLSAMDFPVIACAVSRSEDGIRCAIGARPRRAELAAADSSLLSGTWTAEKLAAYAESAAASLDYGTNLRGTAAYRREMAEVLCRRLLVQLTEEAGR